MKHKMDQNRSDPQFRQSAGLAFVGILLLGMLVIGLAFRLGWLRGLPFVSQPTEVPTLNSLPSAVPVVNFDLSRANQVVPADVLKEITFYAGGGGGGEGCPPPSAEPPFFMQPPDQAEWLSPVFMMSCNWPPGEMISLTVLYEGSPYATERIQDDGQVVYDLPISISMGVGDYTIVMDSPGGHIETTVHIYRPSAPRLYRVGDEELVLYSFAPNEAVRFFDYSFSGDGIRLSGWSQYQVDPSGMLIIHAPAPTFPDHFTYYIVGNQSGLVELSPQFGEKGEARPILVAPCGREPSYLEHNRYASTVNASVEARIALRTGPGLSHVILSWIHRGTLVVIVDGPVCIDDGTWWFIQVGNGESGWMPEYQAGAYLLKPYPKDSFSQITSALPELVFDSDTANPVSPEDVFIEVDFSIEKAKFCDRPPYPAPTIFLAPNNRELQTPGSLIVCGWQPNEVLKGTIQYPDGRLLSQFFLSQYDGYTYYGKFEFSPTLDDPPGIYTFTLKGQKESVTATAEFRAPDGPRLYELDWDHSLLYHFGPQESVRLLCYDYRGRLLAWQDITADQSGNKPIIDNTGGCTFVALGQTSGEVHEVRDWIGTVKKSCGGLSSRLNVNIQARVMFTDGIAKPVRAAEGYAQGIITSLPEGTIINLVKGPRCADNNLWWLVETPDHVSGWMPEEQNGVYLLEPVGGAGWSSNWNE